MKDTGLRNKKAEALYRVYRRGLSEGRFNSMYEAGAWCAKQPAPCYFISAKAASLLIGRLMSNVSLVDMHSTKRRLTWKLYEDYQQFLAEHPDTKLSRERIMELLVDRPAPEFYITGDYARKILRKEIRKARKRLGWYD